MKKGAELIKEERERQIKVEGWTPKHDAEHINDEIVFAAICYLTPNNFLIFRPSGFLDVGVFKIPNMWPWADEWYKPAPDNKKESRIRELQKAGALIAAEIDRLLLNK